MKVGIVTNYNKNTVNYGNVLQTFALNYYLRSNYPLYDIVTIKLHDDFQIGKVKTSYVVAVIRKLKSLFTKKKEAQRLIPDERRIRKFQEFASNNIRLSEEVFSVEELSNKEYEVLIVGSDVVWSQIRNNYNTIKFLCYKGSEKALKFSYAASFGRNYIPYENRRPIRNALNQFKGIGVREESSVSLLRDIGIQGAVHVCDPTLLITSEQWREIERKPDIIEKGFLLCFLLNPTQWHLELAYRIKSQSGLRCVYVTNGYKRKSSDEKNAVFDIIQDTTSPEEWLWLIDNADYVLTDSFHCMIFSNIFKKKYFVLERDYDVNINNRMIDFLKMIKNTDKFITCDKSNGLDHTDYIWNYEYSGDIVNSLIKFSKKYIDEMLDGKG